MINPDAVYGEDRHRTLAQRHDAVLSCSYGIHALQMPALSWFAPKITASGAASLLPKTQLRRDSEFLLRPEDDSRPAQVIRRELNRHLVAGKDANIVHTHLS